MKMPREHSFDREDYTPELERQPTIWHLDVTRPGETVLEFWTDEMGGRGI